MQKNFFDYYPEQIFSPLSGPNRRLYLNLLMSIYNRFFNETSDLDDVSLPGIRLKNHIKDYLISTSVWFDEQTEQESVLDAEQVHQKSLYIYSRFVETGWLREEQRGHKLFVFMAPKILELLEFLDKAGRNLSKFVGGYVVSVYQGLKSIANLEDDSLIAFSLDKAKEDSVTMGKRMNNLAMHLREITEKISEFTDTNKKADTFFNDFINQSSFSDYNDIKKADHPLRFKSDILRFLNDIEHNPNIRSRVVTALKQADDNADPEYELNKYVQTIRRIFINTDNLLYKVDNTHAKLAIRFNESIRYRRRAGTNIRSLIEISFHKLIAHPEIESLDLHSMSPEISGVYQDHLFKVKRKKTPLKKDEGSEVREVSSFVKVRDALHREYLESMKITDTNLLVWLDNLLSDRQKLDSLSIKIESPEDFAMFVQALRLCNEGKYFVGKFKKTLSSYRFISLGEKPVEHEAFYCPVFRITKHT